MNRTVLTLIFSLMTISLKATEKEDSLSRHLNEIVVAATPKIVSTKGSLTTIRIDGTPYTQIGSASEMLKNIPGMIDKAGDLEVAGYGKPLYIIDGREITNDGELSLLKSADIKSIKIERNPGALYSPDVKAVVIITTKKSLSEFLYLNISNSLSRNRQWSETPSLNLKTKISKFTTSLSYMYLDGNALNKETYFRDIAVSPDLSFNLRQPRELRMNLRDHNINFTGEYHINESNRIGIYYYMTHAGDKTVSTGSTEAGFDVNLIANSFSKANMTSGNLHSITARYTYVKGSTSLQITQDYATRNSKLNMISREEEVYGDVTSKTRSKYDIATSNIRFYTKLPLAIGLSIGSKYNYVNSSSSIKSSGDINYEVPAVNIIEVKEHNPQAYLIFDRKIGNVQLSPGLRYEYTNRRISSIIDQAEPTDLSDSFTRLYPSISASYNNSYGLNLYLNYYNQISQPRFRQLNSGSVYDDAYAYNEGNPSLKSSISNTFSIGASFHDFNITVNYRKIRNSIVDVESVADQSNNLVKIHSINIPDFHRVRTSIGYSKSIGKFNVFAEAAMTKPYAKILINGKMQRRDQISIDINLNATYAPFKWMSFYTTFNHQGHNVATITMTQKSVQLWNFGVNASFINDRLTVNLEASDILDKAHFSNLTGYYQNVKWGTRGTNDMRGFRLTLSYTIFNKPIRTATTAENRSVVSRTE